MADQNDIDKKLASILDEMERLKYSNNNNRQMSATMTNIGIILLLGATTWIFSTTQKLETTTAVMSQTISNNNSEIGKMQNKIDVFTAKPRFTQDDFDNEMKDFLEVLKEINKKVDQNTRFRESFEYNNK